MNEWQVSATQWLTHWLDSLAAADTAGDMTSSASLAAEFIALLQDMSDAYSGAAQRIVPATGILIDELQTQLDYALALRRSLANQFDWSYALLLPLFISEGRDLRWRELVFNAVSYQREVTALNELYFGILDRALKDFRAELLTLSPSVGPTVFELSNKLMQHLHRVYRGVTTSHAYKQHQGAALVAFTQVRECWQRIIADEIDSTAAGTDVGAKSKSPKNAVLKKSPRKRRATAKAKKFP